MVVVVVVVKPVTPETDQKEWERSSEAERKNLLHRLWLAEARAMLAILENTAPADLQAAQLAAARAFLRDNGARSDNLGNPPNAIDPMTEELSRQVRALQSDDGESALPEAGDDEWPGKMDDKFTRDGE